MPDESLDDFEMRLLSLDKQGIWLPLLYGDIDEPELGTKRHGQIFTLTVAHLNHNTRDDRRENLAVLCAPCHITYDNHHRQEQKRINAEENGQLNLIDYLNGFYEQPAKDEPIEVGSRVRSKYVKAIGVVTHIKKNNSATIEYTPIEDGKHVGKRLVMDEWLHNLEVV
jgi:hypothetical protein